MAARVFTAVLYRLRTGLLELVNYGVVLCTVKNAHYPEINTTAVGTGSAIFILQLMLSYFMIAHSVKF